MVSFAFSQQLNYTSGRTTPGGALWSNDGITYIDTLTGTTNDIIVDLDDYALGYDINPVATTDSANTGYLLNSNRFVLGTFYCYFDNQGTGSPTTDSVLYTIKVYPGVYTSENKAISGLKYGTAVTLETIRVVNDYLSINNVYVHATKYKHFPPEAIKIEIAPIGDADCDDSTKVNWRMVYPQRLMQDLVDTNTSD